MITYPTLNTKPQTLSVYATPLHDKVSMSFLGLKHGGGPNYGMHIQLARVSSEWKPNPLQYGSFHEQGDLNVDPGMFINFRNPPYPLLFWASKPSLRMAAANTTCDVRTDPEANKLQRSSAATLKNPKGLSTTQYSSEL